MCEHDLNARALSLTSSSLAPLRVRLFSGRRVVVHGAEVRQQWGLLSRPPAAAPFQSAPSSYIVGRLPLLLVRFFFVFTRSRLSWSDKFSSISSWMRLRLVCFLWLKESRSDCSCFLLAFNQETAGDRAPAFVSSRALGRGIYVDGCRSSFIHQARPVFSGKKIKKSTVASDGFAT